MGRNRKGVIIPSRTVREVFEDHLQNRSRKDLDRDISNNYAGDVVILTGYGIFTGHYGVRQSGAILQADLPHATYHYRTTLDAGEIAFLEWTADSDAGSVDDGVDSFLIRDGRILVQTIHYTVTQT